MANLEQVKSILDEPQCANNQERKILHEHIEWMQNQQALELQALYVNTFDMVDEHTLHLTYHLLGDDRERGSALIDLNVDTIFKIHLFFGMTVFLLFPFTRLVHIWSFPFGYLSRACLLVRTKRKLVQSSERKLIRFRRSA